MTEKTRKIIHVDMDCFYAAVEVKHKPSLRGKPLGIGGPPESRSVLCTASYEARKFGVRAAMPSSKAVRLCPQIILLPPNFSLYREESEQIKNIFFRFTHKVEPLSLDEAYLDVTECTDFKGSATRIATEIRRLIQLECKLTASAGVAPNKFLAKVASDWKKPNGQFVISPKDVDAFVFRLPVEKIPGVGKVTAKQMHQDGIRLCSDLQALSLEDLKLKFGKRGDYLAKVCRGRDERPVENLQERKSLTVEETFHKDLVKLGDWLEALPRIYRQWQIRMNRSALGDRIKGAVVKVKYYDFQTSTHEFADKAWPTEEVFAKLVTALWQKRGDPIRLLGLGVRLAGDDLPKANNPSQLPLPYR